MRLLLASIHLSVVVLGLFLLLDDVEANDSVGGSCWAARLCCQGRNLTCHVMSTEEIKDDKEVEDEKISHQPSQKRSMCFCDSACMVLNDCCHDYKLACQPVDCAVSDDWSDWSECDARCGHGVKNRTRKILQKPLNGGKECPSTVERIACEGTNCKVARANEGQDELRETGRIIPANFGEWRNDIQYNPFKDIRRNLFEKYHRKTMKLERESYCMKFEVTEVWPACQTKADNATSEISKGNTVCVECQPQAMKQNLGSRCKGQGVLTKETRWKAVLTSGCRGKWVLKSRQEDCSCQSSETGNFILL